MIDEYEQLIRELSFELNRIQPVNRRKWDYYDSEAAIKNIGLAVPQSMVNVDVVLGWPEIIVDAIDERLDWLGWSSNGGDISGLKRVFRDNRLGVEFDKAKLDALITGVGFIEVSAGAEGEPAVIANAVSSMDATYRWDARANRVEAGLVRKHGALGEEYLTLYLPDRTVSIVRDGVDEQVTETVHNRGVAGLIPIPNRSRATDSVRGKSEISKSIRYYTDHGVRTLLGMEYNREIYTTPQRWYKNVFAEDFGFSEDDSAAEIANRGVKIAMNRTVIMEPNISEDGTNGPEPATGQYESAPPTPYIEQLKMLAQLCAAQSGVPANYFGFHTEQPPSADAIRSLESRLIKRAERRQALFDEPLLTLAYVSQTILDGTPDLAFMSGLSVQWRDPATPTRAAAMDAGVKAVSAGILDADSTVLLELIGYTPDQIERIQQEKARSVARNLVESIRERQIAANPQVENLVSNRLPVGEESLADEEG